MYSLLLKRVMGADSQHVKLTVENEFGRSLQLVAFNAPAEYFIEPGQHVDVWIQPNINEWQGRRSVEGQLLRLKVNS